MSSTNAPRVEKVRPEDVAIVHVLIDIKVLLEHLAAPRTRFDHGSECPACREQAQENP